ncbi:hypothetical protein JTE90_003234 [Oedothorax gibbosus]|uniref:Uncharacterized protein n=1 Tax=Oedothorax gibbosus TaxID=931172 RepID=A0AAV6UNC0_9ARAC|nr:hypothetical protein JTE90_003234 [Oedothorax gibbosus]
MQYFGWMAAGHSSPVLFLTNSRDAVDVEGGDDSDDDIHIHTAFTNGPQNGKAMTVADENSTSDLPAAHPATSLSIVTRGRESSLRGRRTYTPGPGKVGSRLRISNLDIHDTGYYKCEALSGGAPLVSEGGPSHQPRVESTGILIVRAGRIQPPATIPNFPPVFPHFPALGGK